MLYKKLFKIVLLLILLFYPMFVFAQENIDPYNDDSQYAFGENVGWLNAEPSGDGGPGLEVTDSKVTGYIWAENIGWVNLSCENRSSCDTVNYGVTNDNTGNLSGYGWGENVGWISFSCLNTDSCHIVDYGVIIDPLTGEFNGQAWGENVGWVTFRSESPVAYGVTTSWPGCEDLSTFAAAYGSVSGDTNYNASCDHNDDGDVDGVDLYELAILL